MYNFRVYNKNYDQNIFNLDSSVNNIIDDSSDDEFELQVTNDENSNVRISVIPVFDILEENDLSCDPDIQ